MKNKLIVAKKVICVLAFVLILFSCDDGSDTTGGDAAIDLGGGIKAQLRAYHYGPDSHFSEYSYVHLYLNSRSVATDESVDSYDYAQDFQVTVNGTVYTFNGYVDISGGDIRFDNNDASIITTGQEYTIQIKYTANSDRIIKVWIPDRKIDDNEPGGYWRPPASGYSILSSFDTGVKTVVAKGW